MAEAVEARRIELRLSVGEMIERSGITSPGWAPVRKGYRRRYQDKLKFAVAKALDWETDAIDRMLRGEAPIPLGRHDLIDQDVPWAREPEEVTVADLDRRVRALEADRPEILRLLRKVAAREGATPDPSAPATAAEHRGSPA